MTKLKQQPAAVKPQRYTILPLKWEKQETLSYQQKFTAETTFGSFHVERHREDWQGDTPWGPWQWGYCFDEYHDEASAGCRSAAEGKRLAQAEWERRLSHGLAKVK